MEGCTIEFLGKTNIDLHSVGDLVKGKPLPCSRATAWEFRHDKMFRVTGLENKAKLQPAKEMKGGTE